jgi:hypothetical protein
MTLTRREPLRTHTRLQRKTPLRSGRRDPVTARTRRLMVERSGGRCEIQIADACRARRGGLDGGWQYSHIIRRADSPSHGPEAGLVACLEDHLLVERHFGWARRYGWRASAWDCLADVRVLLPDGRWVLLTAAGRYLEVRSGS